MKKLYIPIENIKNKSYLGYYPIIPLSYVWGHITGIYNTDYINTVKTIYNRVNYNLSILNTLPFIEDVTYQQVDEVINAYGNLIVSNEKLEQWQPTNFNSAKQQEVYALVQRASGVNAKYTKMILDELYWAIKDSSVSNVKWIRPREFKEYQEYREQNNNTKGNEWLSDSVNITKWLLILGAVGIGSYLLFNIYTLQKAVK